MSRVDVIVLLIIYVSHKTGVIVYRAVIFGVLIASDGSLRRNSKLFVTGTAATINLIVINILKLVYRKLALIMTEWENPRTRSSYEKSFTLKMFWFQFCNMFSSVFYVAFFKVCLSRVTISSSCSFIRQNLLISTKSVLTFFAFFPTNTFFPGKSFPGEIFFSFFSSEWIFCWLSGSLYPFRRQKESSWRVLRTRMFLGVMYSACYSDGWSTATWKLRWDILAVSLFIHFIGFMEKIPSSVTDNVLG